MVDGDELGPIDYLVVEFPAGSRDFGGELARELASLVDAEMVRVLDMLVLEKDEDGHVEAFEMGELGDRSDLADDRVRPRRDPGARRRRPAGGRGRPREPSPES